MAARKSFEKQHFHAALATLVLGFLAFKGAQELFLQFADLLNASSRLPRSFILLNAAAAGLLILFIALLWFPAFTRRWISIRNKLQPGSAIFGALMLIPFIWLLLFSKWSSIIDHGWLRFYFVFSLLLIFSSLLSKSDQHFFTMDSILAGWILFTSAFIVVQELQNARAFPFSWEWSEGNRLWDYSLLYGKRRYIYPAGQPIYSLTDIGRQSLWGIPFIFDGISIQWVRAWGALMFTLPYFLLGLLAFRHRQVKTEVWVLVSLWVMVFLHHAPVYAPLIVVALLVLLTRSLHWLPAMILIVLAGYYAYLSRYTWMFTAGMWAALIHFLDIKSTTSSAPYKRWTRTIFLGLAGIFGGFLLAKLVPYIPFLHSIFPQQHAGVGDAGFSISNLGALLGRQPLLWDLLWPNTTNPLGIIPSLLLAVLPLGILLLIITKRLPWKLDIYQKLLLWAEILAFLVVGVVISVKIGGGSNLHNLDMLFVTLVLIAGMTWRAGGANWILDSQKRAGLAAALMLFMVVYPAYHNIMAAAPLNLPTAEEARDAVGDIQKEVDAVLPAEILFIDQRQLLTFDAVKNVPLIVEYEKKVLMDNAMADDQAYFDGFYADLRSQRFGLIISEPLRTELQGAYHGAGFGRENDAWVNWVSIPVLCYYEPVSTNPRIGIEMLKPRTSDIPVEIQAACEALK